MSVVIQRGTCHMGWTGSL